MNENRSARGRLLGCGQAQHISSRVQQRILCQISTDATCPRVRYLERPSAESTETGKIIRPTSRNVSMATQKNNAAFGVCRFPPHSLGPGPSALDPRHQAAEAEELSWHVLLVLGLLRLRLLRGVDRKHLDLALQGHVGGCMAFLGTISFGQAQCKGCNVDCRIHCPSRLHRCRCTKFLMENNRRRR